MKKKKLTDIEKHTVLCPHCGKKILDHMTECPYCKKSIDTGYKPMDPSYQKRIKDVLWVVLGAGAIIIIILALTGRLA